MNHSASDLHQLPLTYSPEVIQAAASIAPAWPLDKAIAVNPWWQQRHQTFSTVAGELAALGQVQCLMPGSFYRTQWLHTIQEEHLLAAAHAENVSMSVGQLLDALDDESALSSVSSFCDMLDSLPEQSGRMLWRDEIVQQISQFCGLYFCYPGQVAGSADAPDSLYRAWLEVVQQDKGIEVVMKEPGLQKYFKALPENSQQLCQAVSAAYGHPQSFAQYLQALLLEIHGWAAFMAYKSWQDNFVEVDHHWVEQLLCIRLAWDWVLWQHCQDKDARFHALPQESFLNQFEHIAGLQDAHVRQQQVFWVWHRALELSYQSQLQMKLADARAQPPVEVTPVLQAAFCIDVRSEPMRRALEAQHPGIETLGFAGFFGLPLEYTFSDSDFTRPQLPGLLMPAIQATQCEPVAAEKSVAAALRRAHQLDESLDAAPASLGLVEMLGILKSGALLKNSLFPGKPDPSLNSLCDDRPFTLSRNQVPLSLDEKVELCSGILNAMSLTGGFARHVLLVGHGSCTANNPQAASLDCGACGGQTGEVNVKVLAQLLNDESLRQALLEKGIAIPADTRFVAAMHNTTTDEIVCYGVDENEPWAEWLSAATVLAQRNRGTSMGMADGADLSARYEYKSRDWSEPRAEWGLANNAAFIVAPRSLTKGIDLEGRVFLHDYVWQQDEERSVLELIMTAPMIVTNWINLQYYASVTDNRLYGSGNKLLHNVVGEHIGVFEGNGGDLRIGLSLQSVHDGSQWRHMPQRLSVYIAAPREAIADIVSRHDMVSQLIDNEWLYLFQLDEQTGVASRYYKSQWQENVG